MDQIESLNPYGTFRSGQKESVEEILSLAETGQTIIEYNGPTGCGKSLVLSVVCRALQENYPKSIYTSPQKNLVSQIANDKKIGMVSLLGRDNYSCPKAKSNSAKDCPIPAKLRRKHCPRCEYIIAKDKFLAASLGIATLDKILVDKSIPKPDILVVDESQNIEEKLLNNSEIEIPDTVDLNDLVESSKMWIRNIEMEIMKVETKLEKAFARNMDAELRDFIKEVDTTAMAKTLVRYNGILTKARGVLRMAETDPSSYIITEDRNFRMMSGRKQFQDLIMNTKLVVLASGTPATALLVPEYSTVLAPHPISVERRMNYFLPVGKMNLQNRDATMEKMGPIIADLHKKHGRSTIVHIHSYPLATRLGNIIYDEGVRCQWVDPKDREGSIKTWMETENTCLMAVACSEGLDLHGPKYPLGIIAKIPYGFRGSDWVLAREARDKPLSNDQRFEEVRIATEIQQASGRCCRGPEDFSSTYILDSSFESFYRRNYNLFQPWWRESLRRKS
jgi:Rad3-related DNA helicase